MFSQVSEFFLKTSQYNCILIKLSIILIGFIYCTTPSNKIIKELLDKFKITETDERGEGENDDFDLGMGALIGILERWIILTLVIYGNFTALAFIIAAKTAIRYKKFETSKHFSEYFIVGTLSSVVIALLIGILIKFIIYK
jgi:hypothetical protein